MIDWRTEGERFRQRAIDGGINNNPPALALLAVYCELRHQDQAAELRRRDDGSTRAMERLSAMLDQHGEMLAQTMRR